MSVCGLARGFARGVGEVQNFRVGPFGERLRLDERALGVPRVTPCFASSLCSLLSSIELVYRYVFLSCMLFGYIVTLVFVSILGSIRVAICSMRDRKLGSSISFGYCYIIRLEIRI